VSDIHSIPLEAHEIVIGYGTPAAERKSIAVLKKILRKLSILRQPLLSIVAATILLSLIGCGVVLETTSHLTPKAKTGSGQVSAAKASTQATGLKSSASGTSSSSKSPNNQPNVAGTSSSNVSKTSTGTAAAPATGTSGSPPTISSGPRQVSAAGGTILAGLDTPLSNEMTAIQELGRTPALINTFTGFQNSNGSQDTFPTSFVSSVIGWGSTPMITWQANLSSYTTTSVLTSISDGSEDSYITAWAQAAKATNHTLYLRILHEFNGEYYPWGEVVSGVTPLDKNQLASNPPSGTYPYTNTSAMFIAAYQHITRIFQQVGATNVQFIWCFGAGGTNMAAYYPGNASVAWASLDGYNRSTTSPESFSSIFSQGYAQIVSITNRPIIISETASVDYSGAAGTVPSKASWLNDAYSVSIPQTFPHIRAINYFDSKGAAGYTYPFDSSTSSLTAIKAIFASPLYQATAATSPFSF
jgi:hypothetical protein